MPWLATQSEWSADNKKLTLTLRPGVQWSDGTPFTANDVAFTFELLKKHQALDFAACGASSRASRPWTTRRSSSPVACLHARPRLHRPAADRAGARLEGRPGPGHLHQRDTRSPPARSPRCACSRTRSTSSAATRTTGSRASPRVEALRFPAYPGNDRPTSRCVFDEVDWAGNFVPAIDRVFVANGPGPPPLLVPAHRQHHLPLREHHARALRRRAGAQGAQHGHRPRPAGRRGHVRLHAARRRHRRSATPTPLARPRGRRRRRLGAPRSGRAPTPCSTRRACSAAPTACARLPDGTPLTFDIHVGLRLVGLGARRAGHRPRTCKARRHRRRRDAPTTSAPGSSASRRASFDLSIGWSFDGPDARTTSTAG